MKATSSYQQVGKMEDNTGSMQSGLSIMNPAFGSIHVGSILNTQEEEEDAKERELRNAEVFIS